MSSVDEQDFEKSKRRNERGFGRNSPELGRRCGGIFTIMDVGSSHRVTL
jgi:hypothetical protein